MNKFDKLKHPDQTINLIQDRVASTFEQFFLNPLLDGKLVQTVLRLGTNRISHKLGRQPVGYLIVQKDGEFTYHDDGKNEWNDRLMTLTLLTRLTTREDINVTLYVF